MRCNSGSCLVLCIHAKRNSAAGWDADNEAVRPYPLDQKHAITVAVPPYAGSTLVGRRIWLQRAFTSSHSGISYEASRRYTNIDIFQPAASLPTQGQSWGYRSRFGQRACLRVLALATYLHTNAASPGWYDSTPFSLWPQPLFGTFDANKIRQPQTYYARRGGRYIDMFTTDAMISLSRCLPIRVYDD